MYGELIPVGGGDPIVLHKQRLRVGRRESCDIVLRFANVSAHHCLLTVEDGYWFVKDLNSRNGVKVNDVRLKGDARKRIDPDDVISIAKHKYEFKYVPADLGAVGPPPSDEQEDSFLSQSLLERAGLQRRSSKERDADERYDVTDSRAGQLKHDPNRPT